MGSDLVCVVTAPAVLGEGPIWSASEGLLYWVDIKGRTANAFDPRDGRNRSWPLPADVGTIVPARDGGCVVALRDGLAAFDPRSGSVRMLGATHGHPPRSGFRFNDGKCDPAGRLWVGSMHDDVQAGAAHLYRYDRVGGIQRMVEGVTVSNGLTWSADGRTMYYVDSVTHRVDAFSFDVATGAIADRRTVVRFPEAMGYPDGIAIDAQGMLWVALWEGWRVQRCDPSNGALLEHIALPVARVSACAFGGPGLDELYITTARIGLDAAALAGQPQAGCLFSCKPGVAGLPTHAFAG